MRQDFCGPLVTKLMWFHCTNFTNHRCSTVLIAFCLMFWKIRTNQFHPGESINNTSLTIIPLLYLTGTPERTGGNPLPACIGCTIPAGRGGPVNWGVRIIWDGGGTSKGLFVAAGYGMGATGCLGIATFCWMVGLGLGGLDMVGIFLTSCWPAEEEVTGTGASGRGWPWRITGAAPETFMAGRSLGLGLVCRNGQKGFKHPVGWDSQ